MMASAHALPLVNCLTQTSYTAYNSCIKGTVAMHLWQGNLKQVLSIHKIFFPMRICILDKFVEGTSLACEIFLGLTADSKV